MRSETHTGIAGRVTGLLVADDRERTVPRPAVDAGDGTR